jgi:hypothetical protein
MSENKLTGKRSRNESEPTLEEWAKLYESAIEFKKIAPWDWMWDADLFGVQNPDTKEIGYCCILGKLGEVYGLVAYLGSAGLESYFEMQHFNNKTDKAEIFFKQKCLTVTFNDREYLESEDLKVIKTLGLKFRGRNEYPQLRSQLPGFMPWFITKDEGLFLNMAILQAIDIALRFKKDPTLLAESEKSKYLVRVPKISGNELIWSDAWLKPEPWQKSISLPSIDEPRLRKINASISSKLKTWEVDAPFLLDMPIMDKERAYVPRVLVIVNSETSFILGSNIVKPSEYTQIFADNFLNIIEKNSILPERIIVKSNEIFQLLYPITSFLGIRLEKVVRLRQLELVLREMTNLMTKRSSFQ